MGIALKTQRAFLGASEGALSLESEGFRHSIPLRVFALRPLLQIEPREGFDFGNIEPGKRYMGSLRIKNEGGSAARCRQRRRTISCSCLTRTPPCFNRVKHGLSRSPCSPPRSATIDPKSSSMLAQVSRFQSMLPGESLLSHPKSKRSQLRPWIQPHANRRPPNSRKIRQ